MGELAPTLADNPQDMADLRRAVALLLEAPTLSARMANLVGSPLEFAVRRLPAGVSRRIQGAAEAALHKAAQAALWSMDRTRPGNPVRWAVPAGCRHW